MSPDLARAHHPAMAHERSSVDVLRLAVAGVLLILLAVVGWLVGDTVSSFLADLFRGLDALPDWLASTVVVGTRLLATMAFLAGLGAALATRRGRLRPPHRRRCGVRRARLRRRPADPSAGGQLRTYRTIVPHDFGDERSFSSLRRTVEHEAMVAMAARELGVPTPPFVALASVDPDAFVLVYQLIDGSSLDGVEPGRLAVCAQRGNAHSVRGPARSARRPALERRRVRVMSVAVGCWSPLVPEICFRRPHFRNFRSGMFDAG